MNILKPWTKFDPREQMNELFCAHHMPHYVSYTSVVNDKDVFDHRVTIVVMDSPACGYKPILIIQLAEQYNGQYDSFNLEQFRLHCDCEGWEEVVAYIEAKVAEVLKDFTY